MTSNYSLMTKPSLEEITKKIDQFLEYTALGFSGGV